MLLSRRGQVTVETAAIIVIVVAAIITSARYVKRGIMGKMRESADQIGEQFNPYAHEGTLLRTFEVGRTEDSTAKGELTTSDITERQDQEGTEVLGGKFDDEPIF